MKKIGILTFQNAINYGAILQNYALQEYLISLGYSSETINYQNEFINDIYSIFPRHENGYEEKIKRFVRLVIYPFQTGSFFVKKAKFKGFIRSYIHLSKKCSRVSIESVCKKFDFVLVGSDQIWNGKMSNYDTTYYLDFFDDNERKISYAASFGKSFFTGYDIELMAKFLPKFHFLSVREREGADFLYKHLNIHANVCLDPTLLWNSKFWIKHVKKNKQKRKYIFVYLVQESKKLDFIVEKYAKEKKLTIISLSKLNIKKYKLIKDAGIEDFLTLIFFSEMVFATSFHAIAFSIVFQKQFFYELSKNVPNNNSRIIDLCDRLSIKEREVGFFGNSKEAIIEYNKVELLLEKLRVESTDMLKKSLGYVK